MKTVFLLATLVDCLKPFSGYSGLCDGYDCHFIGFRCCILCFWDFRESILWEHAGESFASIWSIIWDLAKIGWLSSFDFGLDVVAKVFDCGDMVAKVILSWCFGVSDMFLPLIYGWKLMQTLILKNQWHLCHLSVRYRGTYGVFICL